MLFCAKQGAIGMKASGVLKDRRAGVSAVVLGNYHSRQRNTKDYIFTCVCTVASCLPIL
jgi:hypothetical protein